MIFRKTFVLILLGLQFSYSQNASSREWTIFQKGLAEYNSGNYDLARQSFSLMISKLPNSMLITANYLMLAKTNYKTADYQASLVQCEEFKKKFPYSSYIDDIIFLMGNNYYKLNRIETAVTSWLTAGFKTNDKILQRKSLSIADEIISSKLNHVTIEKLEKENKSSPISESFKYHLASYELNNGNEEQAREQLVGLEKYAQSQYYKEKIQLLIDHISGSITSGTQIAVLLPLTGVNEEIGKSLLLGFELGLNEYNKTASEKISLIKYDYSSDLVSALEQMKKVSSNHSVIAVFGPVENEIAAACGIVADYEGLTLLSPTASMDKLVSISHNSILLAPSVKVMARSIQSFAYDSLALKRIATFSPIDDYYIEMTDEFTEAHIEDGGQIVAQEWYYSGDQNYKDQFRKLKRVGLKLLYQDSVKLDHPDLSEKEIDSLYKDFVELKKEHARETKTKVDSADIAVTTFDGMFIPLYDADISYVASQFAYSNLKTQLIGNSDWYNLDALKKNRNYVNGIIFVTDGYLNEEDWDFRQFRNNFRTTYNKTPEKFELIAYDSFKFISQVFKNKPLIDRAGFIKEITRLKEYNGIYRSFNIDEHRINNSVRILKYIYGQIIPVR